MSANPHHAANLHRATKVSLRAGLVLGQITLIERIPGETGKHDQWRCKCTCGEETTVRSSNLVSGKTKSCGCARRVKKAETKQMTSQRWSIATHEALEHLVRLWKVDSTMATELAIQYLGIMAASPDTTPQWLELIPKKVIQIHKFITAPAAH